MEQTIAGRGSYDQVHAPPLQSAGTHARTRTPQARARTYTRESARYVRARERARAYVNHRVNDVNRLQRRIHSLAVVFGCVVNQSSRRENYTIIRFLKRTLLAHSTLDERLLHCMLQAQGQLSHSHPIQGEPSWAWTQAGWPLNPPLLTSIVLT